MPTPGHVPAAIKFVLFWLIDTGVLLGLWFLYTATVNKGELIAGVCAAAIAATGAAVVQGERFARFSPRPGWLLLVFHEPWPMLKDSFAVWREGLRAILGRQPKPEMRAVPFAAGGDDDVSAARRALAITLTSIPANTIVVGIDRQERIALVHFLSPAPTPPELQKLGARE